MIYVQQVTVEVEGAVAAHLDGGVGGLGSDGAGREGHLCKDGEGRQGDLGEALGGVFGLVDDDLLDIRVGGLGPVRLDGSHFWCRWGRVWKLRLELVEYGPGIWAARLRMIDV